jgi:hypothetical protein
VNDLAKGRRGHCGFGGVHVRTGKAGAAGSCILPGNFGPRSVGVVERKAACIELAAVSFF